jgi:hypothetical protein
MATGIYEWKDKQPVPDFGSMVGTATKDPATPAPMQSPSTPTSGGSMFGGGAVPSFGDMVKAGPSGSSPTPSFNDLFSGMGDTRAENLQGAQQAIGQGLNPTTPSAGSQVARNSFIKAQEAAERKVLEQSALSGRDETGQIRGDRQDFLTQQALPQRMDFEAQLQAQEEQQAQARQQNAVGNLLAMEGLGEQGRGTDAQNALAARGQDITVRGQDIQERQANKSLAESARQFNTRQDFEAWATKGGWDQDAIARAWQSGENAADRSLTASEGSLDRALDRYLGEGQLDIDRGQLAETIRQFDGKIAFDTWATQAGLDDNAAARVWEGHLQDLQQKWTTGERLGSQDHQVLIEDKRVQAQTAAQEFDRLTNLEVLGKTQEWDRAKLDLTNTYQTLRDSQAMSHEQAMTVMKGQIETSLTQMGIDAQTARQAAEIEASKWTTEREIAHESAVANAELLYKYDALREQMGLSRDELNLKAGQLAMEADQFLKTFGLEERKVTAMLDSQEMQDSIGMTTTLLELAGDNPDMIAFATERFIASMGGMKNPDGTPVLSKEEVDGMLEAMRQPAPTGGGTSATMDGLRQWGSGLDSLSEGDILGGLGDMVTGSFTSGTGVVKDAVSGVKKAASWVGSLF